MKLDNVESIFLSGDSTKTLFECAIHWAECGELVWFISPKPFTTLPRGWTKPPDEGILKLIQFKYIPETKDLLLRLCDIHLLPRIPKMIIVMDIDYYLFPQTDKLELTDSAFVISCLLDSTAVFATKFSTKSFLIANCKNSINEKLKVLIDLYFSFNFNCNENTFETIVKIFDKYK